MKIRLISLNWVLCDLNTQLTDSQSGKLTITPKSQVWMGDTENHAWLILVEFIHLILLIKPIKCKIKKRQLISWELYNIS